MVVDFKSEEIKPCRCGFKPDHYSVAYGRTPYDINCPNCKKQTAMAKCMVTGWYANVIDYWNQHIRHITKEQITKEVDDLKHERKENDPYNEYNFYGYYWLKDEGEILNIK